MRAGRRFAAALAGVALAATLAGCTSDGGTSTTSAPPSVTASATTSSATPTDTPTATSPPATPTELPSSTPPSTSTPPPSSSAPPTPTEPPCASLALTVTRVPGAAGVTYGLVTVVNKGSASCSLPGVPALRLLDASRAPMTGTAVAIPASSATTVVDPGDSASTLLEDRSDNCQADTRSTFVEVTATTAAPTVVAALSLPPCSLSVKPFTPGTQPSP